MLDKIKKALQLARANVWGILLALYPFADQLIGLAEANLPALQPLLGPNVYRYMGLAIVGVKFGLQLWRGAQQLGAVLARRAG